MKLKSSKIIDFFLLKKDFYSKLTDKSMWLYIGIALVGIRDVVLAIISMYSSNPDYNKNIQFDVKTIGILFVAAIVIGLVDIISFSYPIFDVIKHFKKRDGIDSMALGMLNSSLLTKVIKVYAVVNIIVTPLDLLGYYTSNLAVSNKSMVLMLISAVLGILGYFWFNGAITRGLCVLFKLPNNVRGLVFVLVFFWNSLLGSAIGYLINHILINL
ncbi:MAG TPA: hypothetical protein VIK78_00490 [Ruminiclostridium sp.]